MHANTVPANALSQALSITRPRRRRHDRAHEAQGRPNDGYTLLLAHIGMSTAPALYRNLPFKPLEDFELVGQVADGPMTFIAKKELPPASEAGLPGFEVTVWHGVYASKGTPKPVIDKLVAALQAGIADPGFVQRMADLGLVVVSKEKATPEGLRTHLKAEIDKWTPIIRKAGVCAE